MKDKINIKTILLTAGAFVSFNVGAGFASGNELLQFFGSWGGGTVAAVLAGFVTTVIYCVCLFYVGQSVNFGSSIRDV